MAKSPLRGFHIGMCIGVCLIIIGTWTPVQGAVIYYRVSEKKNATVIPKVKAPQKITAQKKVPQKPIPVKKKTPTTITKKKTVPSPKKPIANIVKKDAPPAQTSASIVGLKVDTKNSEVVSQKIVDVAAQQKEAQQKAAKETLIQLSVKRAELEKEAADALLPKLTNNPSDSTYREKLRQDHRIGDLYEQFNKLQSQVDSLESDIRSLSKESAPSDISGAGKLMSLQKTKFLLLRQQEDLLQQIELKESYITQLIELAKRDYEFTKRLHDSYMEKYNQTTNSVKSLKEESA